MDPCLRTANFAPFQKKKIAAENGIIILTLSEKWCTFIYCFQICDTKSTYEDTAVKLAWYFSLALQFVRLKNRVSPFALTKHINAVSLKLHCTACWKKMPLTLHGNLLKFLPDILYILQIKTFTNSVFVFPNYLIGGSIQWQCTLIVYCAQCNAYFALCAQKKQMRDLCVLHSFFRGFTIHVRCVSLQLCIFWNFQNGEN